MKQCKVERSLELSMNGRWQDASQTLFAVDTTLTANTELKSSRLVTEIGRVCNWRKFQVNVGKSKVMELNGEVLKKLKSFNYLGATIVANGKAKSDVSDRVNERLKLFLCMKKYS